MPAKCDFVVDGFGPMPIDPGDIFLFNNSYDHFLFNDSTVPRIHMIIYGIRKQKWWKEKIANGLLHAYNLYVK